MTRDDLLRMDPQARAELARTLAALSEPGPVGHKLDERRRWLAVTLTVCCLGMIPWRAAWIGFDIALLASLAVTAWAAYRGRQVMILAGFVTATLLVCDAWFDVLLDWGSGLLWVSLAAALLLELPLATLLILVSRRLLSATIRRAWRLTGQAGPPPSLLDLPILGIAGAARPRPDGSAAGDQQPGRSGLPTGSSG
jgi:hypothetical protein